MGNAAGKRQEEMALLPHSSEIIALARSLKEILDTDVIVVDKYLNRVVNTFQYRHAPNIRINSVVGNIITTQKLQMIYDKRYFADCVNCPDFMTCELGGVFGTPIMCDGECIGAIALLVDTNRLVQFQKKHKPLIEFLQQISVLISQMVQNTFNSQHFQNFYIRFEGILNNVNEAIAVTDLSGVIGFANTRFLEFFSEGGDVTGCKIEEIFNRWSADSSNREGRSLASNLFYKNGQDIMRLRGVQDVEDGDGGAVLLYIFDAIGASSFIQSQVKSACTQDILDDFFGKSPAMEKAKQGALRAMQNHLSILVESTDDQQADALAKVLCWRLKKDDQQLVEVNCKEDEWILETVLLGYGDKFSGVRAFENECVLCLYGIEYLPMYLQKRLLSLLNTERSDGTQYRLRMISTTYLDLYSQVRQGQFSMGLYNQISRNKISVPSSGADKEDIRFYFCKYLDRYCRVYDRPPIQISQEAWSMLEDRHWEGGMLEMRKVVERIAAQMKENVLTQERLAEYLPEEFYSLKGRGKVEENIEAQLRHLLRIGMKKEKMAEELGISRATLYRWLDKFNLRS